MTLGVIPEQFVSPGRAQAGAPGRVRTGVRSIEQIACGLAATPDEARLRADTNDRRNALAVLEDGCRDRASIVITVCGPRAVRE